MFAFPTLPFVRRADGDKIYLVPSEFQPEVYPGGGKEGLPPSLLRWSTGVKFARKG